MKNILDKLSLRQEVIKLKDQNLQIGFVPTMGAIHEGHLSLLKKAKAENDVVICSIFVNPTQFNNAQDFDKYPRTIEKDAALIAPFTDILFTPEADAFYQNETRKNYPLAHLEEVMEGKFRPGHYQGVANVVHLLFKYAQAHRAYFGEKDFQQICVIRKMTELEGHETEIISCPTFRSNKGLALSSRNTLLKNLDKALAIYQAENHIKTHIKPNAIPSKTLLKEAQELYLKDFEVEYFGVFNEISLNELETLDLQSKNEGRVFIAAYLDNVRLIDNLSLK